MKKFSKGFMKKCKRIFCLFASLLDFLVVIPTLRRKKVSFGITGFFSRCITAEVFLGELSENSCLQHLMLLLCNYTHSLY